MRIDEIKEFLGKDWEATQRMISRALESDIALLNATNSSLLANSGKQLRPIMSLLLARSCARGPLGVDSYRYAAAAELLHNATLLHDDVADESDKRRGRPTINSLMGPSVSVLVGDFWLSGAVGCLIDAQCFSPDVLRVFARTMRDLAEGEMLQLEKAEAGDTTEEDYLRIIYCKTASLFVATAIAAAKAIGAPEAMEKAVGDYARNLGIAFQIRDDIFDYSPGMDVGKPVGADILERKITMPLLGAFAAAGKDEEKRVRAMVTAIAEDPGRRDGIVSFAVEHGGLEYAQKRLEEYIMKAKGCLAAMPSSREKEYLEELADYVGARQY